MTIGGEPLAPSGASASASVEDVLAPGFLDGLSERRLEDLHAMRMTCQEVEVALSYVRRIIQGRVDIVAAVMDRQGEDLSKLVKDLPNILAPHSRSPGTGRLPEPLAPRPDSPDVIALTERLDEIVGAEAIGRLPSLSEGELLNIIDRLGDLEIELSSARRKVHEQLDVLQNEIITRYKSGRASVDNLLQ
ncbi:MAG: hypothetical protein M0020_10295 [Actinomycetota bacterium]|nr:hypothetical protein [Actinomycetota bacterium]